MSAPEQVALRGKTRNRALGQSHESLVARPALSWDQAAIDDPDTLRLLALADKICEHRPTVVTPARASRHRA